MCYICIVKTEVLCSSLRTILLQFKKKKQQGGLAVNLSSFLVVETGEKVEGGGCLLELSQNGGQPYGGPAAIWEGGRFRKE